MKILFIVTLLQLVFNANLLGQNIDSVNIQNAILDGPNPKSKFVPEATPLYIIEIDSSQFEIDSADTLTLSLIEPKWIQLINIVKPEKTSKDDGAKGKNGIIYIRLKKDSLDSMPVALRRKLNLEN